MSTIIGSWKRLQMLTILFAGFLLLLCLPDSAFASCDPNYQPCNDERAQRDLAAEAEYLTAISDAQLEYADILLSLVEGYLATADAAYADYQSTQGDCSDTADELAIAVISAFEQSAKGCFDEAGKAYALWIISDDFTECVTKAAKLHSRKRSRAFADFAGDQQRALAALEDAKRVPTSEFEKIKKLNSWLEFVCSRAESHRVTICQLLEDCNSHPANCCADACQMQREETIFNHETTFAATVAPADAERERQIVLCNYRKSSDDLDSYGDYLENLGYLDGANWSTPREEMDDAEILKAKKDAYALHLYQKQQSECACLHPSSLEQFDACIAPHTQTYNDTLAANLTEYDDTMAELQNAYQSKAALIQQQYLGELQEHSATHSSCVNSAQQDYDAILNQATVVINIGYAEADEEYLECLNDNCGAG